MSQGGHGPMRFGLFGSAEARRGGSGADRARGYHAFVEAQVEAEALGYHVTFVTEHHFGGIGQVSDTLGLLSWVAAATRTLRVGTAVIVLPWHDPIILAERAATLDLLSGGRLDLGIGRGYRHTEFEGFMMPVEEAQARFDEAHALMVKAWTSNERFSHEGRFWRYKDIIIEPTPAQDPHPTLWIAAGNPESIAKAAALGCNLLLDQFAS
ncbi:MAG: LLM class flavin-dependent oxidoreductase, partial [Hyphomicrobiaceae bacterium]